MKNLIVPVNRLWENFDIVYGYITGYQLFYGYNRNCIKKLIFYKLRYKNFFNNPYSTALQKFNYEKEFFRKTSKFFRFLNLT